MRNRNFRSSAVDAISRCATPIPGVPLLEVCNSRRILIENHQGVVAYESNEIIVKVRSGNISILGDRLQLNKMSKYQLVITGIITTIHFKEMR